MSLLRRSTSLVKSWLGAFLAPAEDPRRTYADTFEQQRLLLVQVRQALHETIALQRQLESRINKQQAIVPDLEQKARQALLAGREDTARLALQRRQITSLELQAMSAQVHEVQKEEQRLAMVEQRITTQLEVLSAKQQMLAARYSAAEAQVRLNESLSNVSDEMTDLGLTLEQAEQKVDTMQARAAAIHELIETGALEYSGIPMNDPVFHPLSQLEVAQAVESQLDLLKREIQMGRAVS